MMRRVSTALFLILLCVSVSQAAVTTEWAVGTINTLLSTELNSKGSGTCTVAGATYNNLIGQTGNGYTMCRIEGFFTFGAAPTANTAISVWFLKTTDGTNFEDTPNCSTIALGRPPDAVLPVTTGQASTRVAVDMLCPAGQFKPVAKNDGTGQSLAASGNLIRILPFTPQGN